eukprot:COSAG02_NODE_617_length_19476_cov_158.404913_14_plen_165_part_00
MACKRRGIAPTRAVALCYVYEIPDFERAITKAAKADSAFWGKANKHLPVTTPVTKLVNPNLGKVKYQAQLDSAEGGVPADDGLASAPVASRSTYGSVPPAPPPGPSVSLRWQRVRGASPARAHRRGFESGESAVKIMHGARARHNRLEGFLNTGIRVKLVIKKQ